MGGLGSILEDPVGYTNEEINAPILGAEQRDFLNLLNQPEFSDVTLRVEGKQIYAHQVILASRSTFFEALFTNNFQEKEQKMVDFNDSGI